MALARPRSHHWTCEDLLTLPDDGKRYEIIDGALYEMPGPGSLHQIILMNLTLLLGPIIRMLGGHPLAAPIDVFMTGADPVQPDFVALLPDSAARSAARIAPRGVEGPPDLVIEVLSPSNARHDTVTKRDPYRRAGVREYWIVDPAARSIEVIASASDRQDGPPSAIRFAGDAAISSPLLPGADLPLAAVFAGIDDIAE